MGLNSFFLLVCELAVARRIKVAMTNFSVRKDQKKLPPAQPLHERRAGGSRFVLPRPADRGANQPAKAVIWFNPKPRFLPLRHQTKAWHQFLYLLVDHLDLQGEFRHVRHQQMMLPVLSAVLLHPYTPRQPEVGYNTFSSCPLFYYDFTFVEDVHTLR